MPNGDEKSIMLSMKQCFLDHSLMNGQYKNDSMIAESISRALRLGESDFWRGDLE